MRRPFTIFCRKLKNHPVFYVQFRDGDGERMTARSSGCNTRGAAEAWALGELKKGTVPFKAGGNVTLTQFSQDWFVWGRCPYIKRRLAEGKSISQSYAEGRRQYIEHFILPTLGKRRLSGLRRAEIEKWKMALLGKNLAPGTVNSILSVLKLMLHEACNADLIVRNPAAGVGNFKRYPAGKRHPDLYRSKGAF
jgi:hypothetical protein